MHNDVSAFINSTLGADVFPPDNPLLAPGWVGIAFARDRYTNLAPDEVWDAILASHRLSCARHDTVEIISFGALERGEAALPIAADLPSLRHYWFSDGRFMQDHFIFSACREWIVRLDQDVTLVAGQASFMTSVVAKLGGIRSLMGIMVDDFSPGSGDVAGMLRYLHSLTAELTEEGYLGGG